MREFFELDLLSGGQWFLALLPSSRSGSGSPGPPGACPTCSGSSCPRGEDLADDGPRPTHTPRTGEFDAVGEAPTTVAPTEQLPRS